jgi:hypothetical protein
MEVEEKAPFSVAQASRDVPASMDMPRTASVIKETKPKRMA